MFWFRSAVNYFDLAGDSDAKRGFAKDTRAFLFEIGDVQRKSRGFKADTEKDGVGCWIIAKSAEKDLNYSNKPYLECTSGKEGDKVIISQDLRELADIQSWIHLTYSTNY